MQRSPQIASAGGRDGAMLSTSYCRLQNENRRLPIGFPCRNGAVVGNLHSSFCNPHLRAPSLEKVDSIGGAVRDQGSMTAAYGGAAGQPGREQSAPVPLGRRRAVAALCRAREGGGPRGLLADGRRAAPDRYAPPETGALHGGSEGARARRVCLLSSTPILGYFPPGPHWRVVAQSSST